MDGARCILTSARGMIARKEAAGELSVSDAIWDWRGLRTDEHKSVFVRSGEV